MYIICTCTTDWSSPPNDSALVHFVLMGAAALTVGENYIGRLITRAIENSLLARFISLLVAAVNPRLNPCDCKECIAKTRKKRVDQKAER